jgi:hypothetical protein
MSFKVDPTLVDPAPGVLPPPEVAPALLSMCGISKTYRDRKVLTHCKIPVLVHRRTAPRFGEKSRRHCCRRLPSPSWTY